MCTPFKWSPLAIIAPVYYASKIFGILPISYEHCEKTLYEKSGNFIGRKHKYGKSQIVLKFLVILSLTNTSFT